MKKIIGLMLVLALSLTCLTAFAAEEDLVLISEEYTPVIEINGEAIEAAPITDGEDLMLPLRAVCEKLGMNVLWDAASKRIIVEQLPIYLTLSPYEDGYTLAKTAPIKLGKAPVLINGTTYVPLSFVSEIMQGYIFEENGRIAIFFGEEAEAQFKTGVVSEIIKDENQKVSQIVLGENELVLNVGEAEIFSNISDLTIDDIKVGYTVSAISKGMMTMSLPPQMPIFALIVNK